MNVDTSPDGRYLISGSGNAIAYIWDTWDKTEEACIRLESPDDCGAVSVGLFSPDDSLKTVTGSDDSLVTIWRVDHLLNNPNLKKTYNKPDGMEEDVPLAVPQVIKSSTVTQDRPLLPKYTTNTKTSDKMDTDSTFNLSLLLTDLPNFITNGLQPHVPASYKVFKCSTPDRKSITAWLNYESPGNGENKRPRTHSNVVETPSKRIKVKKNASPVTPKSRKAKK